MDIRCIIHKTTSVRKLKKELKKTGMYEVLKKYANKHDITMKGMLVLEIEQRHQDNCDANTFNHHYLKPFIYRDYIDVLNITDNGTIK